MKKMLILVCLSLVYQIVVAQPNEVKLVVTGEGQTKEEATNNALRSAVEQAFGVFVSANTEILNDEVIRDEIATVSSGNIQSFEELAYLQLPEGKIIITIEAVVSVYNLVAYSKSHGSNVEFAGTLFGANIKMREVYKKNEEQAIYTFFKNIDPIHLFNAKLSLDTPFLSDVCSFVLDESLRKNIRERQMLGVYEPSSVNVVPKFNWNWQKMYNLPISINYYPTAYGSSVFKQLERLMESLSIEKELSQYDIENEQYSVVMLNSKKYHFRSRLTSDLLVNYLSDILRWSFFYTWDLLVKNNDTSIRTYSIGTSLLPDRSTINPNRSGDISYIIDLSLFHSLSAVNEWWLDSFFHVSQGYRWIYDDKEGAINSRNSAIELITHKYSISHFTEEKIGDNPYKDWHPQYDALLGTTFRVNEASPCWRGSVYLGHEVSGSVMYISQVNSGVVDVLDYEGDVPFSWRRIRPGESADYGAYSAQENKNYRDEITSKPINLTISGYDASREIYRIKFYLPISEKDLVNVTSVEVKPMEYTSNSSAKETDSNLAQKEDGIVGYWRGEDGSMIYIPSEKVKDSEGRLVYRSFFFYKQFLFDEDHSYCEYNNLYYEGLDEDGNHIYNMDNGHEGGTLLFNKSNQTLSLYSQFHKDPSIAAQLGQIKAEFDAKNNANQSRAAKKIAENPWVLGSWGMGGSVVVVIKNNGIAVVYGTEVVIRMREDGRGYFEEGGEVYTIDWANRAIIFMEDEPLQKLGK